MTRGRVMLQMDSQARMSDVIFIYDAVENSRRKQRRKISENTATGRNYITLKD